MDYTKIPRFNFLPVEYNWESIKVNENGGKGMRVSHIKDFTPTLGLVSIGKGLKRGLIRAKIRKTVMSGKSNEVSSIFEVILFLDRGIGKAYQKNNDNMTNLIVFPLDSSKFLVNRKIGYKIDYTGKHWAESNGEVIKLVSIPSSIMQRNQLEKVKDEEPRDIVVVKKEVELLISDLLDPKEIPNKGKNISNNKGIEC